MLIIAWKLRLSSFFFLKTGFLCRREAQDAKVLGEMAFGGLVTRIIALFLTEKMAKKGSREDGFVADIPTEYIVR